MRVYFTYSGKNFGAGVPRKGKCGSSKPVTITATLRLPAIPYPNAAILWRKSELSQMMSTQNHTVTLTAEGCDNVINPCETRFSRRVLRVALKNAHIATYMSVPGALDKVNVVRITYVNLRRMDSFNIFLLSSS